MEALEKILPSEIGKEFQQSYHIPSAGMEPTLVRGDFVLTDRKAYQRDAPQYGDVAVFKLPDSNYVYIKRIVGNPGDRVQMIDSVLHINRKPADMRKVEPTSGMLPSGFATENAEYFVETLPNGVKHIVIDQGWNSLDNTREFAVPEDHFFVMGNNRDNSRDSRDSSVGYVPRTDFLARATVITLSMVPGSSLWQFWRWPQTVRFDRIGKEIK